MALHDPRRAIESLRNHLAVHDRRLAFLLGSGTSSAINIAPRPGPREKPRHKPLIPGVDDLTEICRAEVASIGAEHESAWDRMVEQCKSAGNVPNVEHVLSLLRMKLDAIGQGEQLAGLGSTELQRIERAICSKIAEVADPPDGIIPQSLPHDDFADWAKKVNRTADGGLLPVERCRGKSSMEQNRSGSPRNVHHRIRPPTVEGESARVAH